MATHTRFTPRSETKEKLEQLFVNREPQLKVALDKIRDSIEVGCLSHTLYVGPRGAGKTHLISLIYHLSKEIDGYGDKFILSFLPEDPREIWSYESLMEIIQENLEPSPRSVTDVDNKVIVVLAENFDDILKRIGRSGQNRFREYIEQFEKVLILATTTSVSIDLREDNASFHGFFDQIDLQPFDVDEATTMLKKIAEYDGNTNLYERLDSADVHMRLAAVQQFAGGLPRIWALFSKGLTIEQIQDLVDFFYNEFDDLTPYYQGQLDKLSINEERIVMHTIKAEGAMTVSQLSKATGIEQRSLSKTIKASLEPNWLIEYKGYLSKYIADKRTTYYTLAEPLARVTDQLKKSKGKPIKAILDFLTAWYSRDVLENYKTQLELYLNNSLTDVNYVVSQIDNNYNKVLALIRYALNQLPSSRQVIIVNLVSHNHNNLELKQDAYEENSIVSGCREIDDALSDFQNKNISDTILALPAVFTNIIEAQLENNISIGIIRLEMALLALRHGGNGEWLQRALSAKSYTTAQEETEKHIYLSCIRLLLGLYDEGRSVLNFALSQSDRKLSDKEWSILSMTISSPVHPIANDVKIELLMPIVIYISDNHLAEFVEYCFTQVDINNNFRTLISSISERMSNGKVSKVKSIDEFLSIVNRISVEDELKWLAVRERIAFWRAIEANSTSKDDNIDSLSKALKEIEVVLEVIATLPDYDEKSKLEFRADRAMIIADLGNPILAITIVEEVLDEGIQKLGSKHPYILMFMGNLAYCLRENEDYTREINVREELYRQSVDILGRNHPDTMSYFRRWLERKVELSKTQNENQACIDEIFNMLPIFENVFGEMHPDARSLHRALVILYEKAGKWLKCAQESKKLYIQSVKANSCDWFKQWILERYVSAKNKLVPHVTHEKYWERFLIEWQEVQSSYYENELQKETVLYSEDTIMYIPEDNCMSEELKIDKFRPDDNFLVSLGLEGIPEIMKKSFFQLFYTTLEMTVGEKLTDGMSDELLDEFGFFVDCLETQMIAWLENNVPEYLEDVAFEQIKTNNPKLSYSQILSEYGALKWLEKNRGDYAEVVKEVLNELCEKCCKYRKLILGLVSNDIEMNT